MVPAKLLLGFNFGFQIPNDDFSVQGIIVDCIAGIDHVSQGHHGTTLVRCRCLAVRLLGARPQTPSKPHPHVIVLYDLSPVGTVVAIKNTSESVSANNAPCEVLRIGY